MRDGLSELRFCECISTCRGICGPKVWWYSYEVGWNVGKPCDLCFILRYPLAPQLSDIAIIKTASARFWIKMGERHRFKVCGPSPR